jgi:hypothetical protein
MSIEVPVLELYDLADVLRGSAGTADEAFSRLIPPGPVGERLQAAADDAVAGFRLGVRGLAVELELLGGTVAGVADSWLVLDETLLARRNQVRAR